MNPSEYGECEHQSSTKITTNKNVAGLLFEYETKECTNCGATLWDQDIEKNFRKWLVEAHRDNPGNFTVENVKLPQELWAYIDSEMGGISQFSVILNACVSLYLKRIIRNHDQSEETILGMQLLIAPSCRQRLNYATSKTTKAIP